VAEAHSRHRRTVLRRSDFISYLLLMDTLCDDVLWRILMCLPGHDITTAMIVCRNWLHFLCCRVTPEQWRQFYHDRVCSWLVVRDSFNWKDAAMVAIAHSKTVLATCIWNRCSIVIVSPWESQGDISFDENNGTLFHGILRPGVTRTRANGTVLDFVYNNMIKLRALSQTCTQRSLTNITGACLNCISRSKKRCTNPEYNYYVRKQDTATNLHEFHECLAMLLSPKEPVYKNRCTMSAF
jgi:hypothetical protein